MKKTQWMEMMRECRICPRECGADRLSGSTGYCGVPAEIYLARADLHFWEEPCLSGVRGSGTVFFSGCVLGCVYCQNYELARARAGSRVTVEELAERFLLLQERGAHNINLVTPTHYTPQIISAVEQARGRGLVLPIVYNCGGYEKVSTLRMLEEIVDIYLVDFKYWEEDSARRYSAAGSYRQTAMEAVDEICRQQPEPVFDPAGMMQRGVIVRQLLLPGLGGEARRITSYLYGRYGDRIYLSLMNQFTPFGQAAEGKYPELNRKNTGREYKKFVDHAIEEGVTSAYVQDGSCVGESFIPSFEGVGYHGGK